MFASNFRPWLIIFEGNKT